MDYEKAYKEALKRAKEMYNQGMSVERIEHIFPELKESEDERIRKEIMDFVVSNTICKDGRREKYLAWLEKQKNPSDKGEISDGYHTFNELYYYRMLYNAAFFNLLPKDWVHKSKKHHDGEECFGGGWFIVMANLPTGQISNHYELENWDLFQIPEKEIADEWDGHTPREAAERIHKFLLERQGGQKETLCDKCRKEQPSHSCQDITELGRCALEHQGEQKPADKVEPKFREGDWVVSKYGNLWRIDSFDEKHYHVSDIDGEYFIPISKQDEIQLYLSQEAKRGVCDAKQELERKGEQKYKFNIGDIISNGQVVYRVENITKNCIGQDCYFLVNVESEKMGMRYLLMSDSKGNTSHFGETTWLCEQVDKSFEKQGEKS